MKPRTENDIKRTLRRKLVWFAGHHQLVQARIRQIEDPNRHWKNYTLDSLLGASHTLRVSIPRRLRPMLKDLLKEQGEREKLAVEMFSELSPENQF